MTEDQEIKWHYIDENGDALGPFGHSEFRRLVQDKKISSDTLVWRPGIRDWIEYAQTNPGPGVRRETCHFCNMVFDRELMLRVEESWVCEGCKNRNFEHLGEIEAHVEPETEPQPPEERPIELAPIYTRIVAKIIDMFALSLLIVPIAMFSEEFQNLMKLAEQTQISYEEIQRALEAFFDTPWGRFVRILPIIYTSLFLGRFGATPGKMAMRIRVVHKGGGRITYMRSFWRAAAEELSKILLLFGYLPAFVDPKKRTMHDFFCSTLVIKVPD